MTKKNRSVLVTGGAGFIGSFLVDLLVERGYKVTIFDNLEDQVHHGGIPSYLNKKARFIKGDVRNYTALKDALDDIDFVYHLASAVGVAQSNYEIKKYTDANVGGTANLLDIIVTLKLPVKKIVSVASMTGYGEGNYTCARCGVVRPGLRGEEQLLKGCWELFCPLCALPVKPIPTGESAQEYPNSIYAISKKTQADMLMLVGQIYKIPVVLLKLFNVYGPRQSLSNPYTGVTAIFTSRIKNNQPALLYEDGMQTRDFVSVHDVVDALYSALGTNRADYQTINIGSGRPIPIIEIAKTLAKLLKREGLVEVNGKYRVNDTRHCHADIRLARRLLAWRPKVSLKQGLEELIKWSAGETAVDNFSKAEKELFSRVPIRK